jgi:lipopolysaccharide transport system permease protein
MMERLNTIWQFRYFWLSLVQMDLRVRYRKSILGLGWSLVTPLMMTAVFCVIFARMLPPDSQDWRSAAPYYLISIAIWDFIKQAAVQGSHTFIRNESYIRQSPLPLAVYCLRTSLGTAVHFCISVLVFLTVASVLNPKDVLMPFYALWAALIGLMLLFIFCVAFASICSFMNIYFHDTQHIVEVVFGIAFFMTPILYDKKNLIDRGYWWIAEFNPAVMFFDMIRDPILTGSVPPLLVFMKAIAATVIMSFMAVLTFQKCERTLIFHL